MVHRQMGTAIQSYRRQALFPDKVAAVCYRREGDSVEFLLVNTGSGRWTFPKGTVERHLGPRDSAALEALEEAGVVGRVSDEHFTIYFQENRGCYRSADGEIAIAAFLLHVHQLTDPEEDHRNPTWFGPHEAKRKLSMRRRPKYQREFARVVDHAVEMLVRERGTRYSRQVSHNRVVAL
jgi:8-oxo-dGTP pyrophosphatase MutT (NUDIX family)